MVNKVLFYVNVSWLLLGTEPRLNINFLSMGGWVGGWVG